MNNYITNLSCIFHLVEQTPSRAEIELTLFFLYFQHLAWSLACII